MLGFLYACMLLPGLSLAWASLSFPPVRVCVNDPGDSKSGKLVGASDTSIYIVEDPVTTENTSAAEETATTEEPARLGVFLLSSVQEYFVGPDPGSSLPPCGDTASGG